MIVYYDSVSLTNLHHLQLLVTYLVIVCSKPVLIFWV